MRFRYYRHGDTKTVRSFCVIPKRDPARGVWYWLEWVALEFIMDRSWPSDHYWRNTKIIPDKR